MTDIVTRGVTYQAFGELVSKVEFSLFTIGGHGECGSAGREADSRQVTCRHPGKALELKPSATARKYPYDKL